ncbi:MAG TPA: hypothetical protein PKC43_11850 [Phycisphaerales bacterium]|nr:hypothetical protein [Phycisphaerales bacterium]HMP38125.1 hypothetical protein [Phycisphaerales bacterium]
MSRPFASGSAAVTPARCALLAAAAALAANLAAAAPTSPFAAKVIAFAPGAGGAAGYDNPLAVLGEPTRFTGVGLFPSVVSPFSPAFLPGEILSIGVGGWIELAFEAPVIDDPSNPFGVDLILFGNTGFIDAAFPLGIVGGVFSDDGGVVEVSADGIAWHVVPGAVADGLMPTLGYLDSGPFDGTPGSIPSDFRKPLDPALALEDVLFLEYDELLDLYAGSGGGTGIDLASVGLAQAKYVRISVPAGASRSIELDAIVGILFARANAADLDGDGVVDGADLGILLGAWGETGPGLPADLDGNGTVDGADLGILLGAWT